MVVLGVKEGAFDLPQDLRRCLSITIVDHLQPFVVPPSKIVFGHRGYWLYSTFVSNVDHCLNFYCVGQLSFGSSNLLFAHVVNIKQVSCLHAINPVRRHLCPIRISCTHNASERLKTSPEVGFL